MYAQLIPYESERRDEAYPKYEAHDFGDERVEAGHDKKPAEYCRANVACSKDGGRMAACDDGGSAHVWVYADFHDGAAGEDSLRGAL